MLLVVGQVVRPHGIHGEVSVELRTDEPAQRFAPGAVLHVDADERSGDRAPKRVDAATRPPAPTGLPAPAGLPAPTGSPTAAGSAATARPPAAAWRVPAKLVVHAARPHQGRMIVAFEGVDDRNIAEELRGVLLCVDSENVAPTDDPDEFHDHQLVGLAARTAEGDELGEVVRVEHAPASDLLVLRRPDGRSALVPFVKAIVTEVDLAGGRVVMAPPEGLFEL